MGIYVYLQDADKNIRINLNAERVDQRITRDPLVYDRANKPEPKARDLKKMRNLFIVTAFIAGNYDVNNDLATETAIVQKHYIEDTIKTSFPAVGKGKTFMTWSDREYTGLVMKCDFTEVGGEENQYELLLEFQEATF